MIEDNPGDVHLLRYALAAQHEAYGLIVLRDGEEALGFVQQQRNLQEEPRRRTFCRRL